MNWLVRLIEWLRPKRREIKRLVIERDHAQGRYTVAVKRFDEIVDRKPKSDSNELG